METNLEQYQFTIREFNYNNVQYKVSLTPELYPEEGDLEFTGRYLILVISEKKGTAFYELEPDHHSKWVSVPGGMDPGLIDEIDRIIQEIRKN